MSIPDKTKEEPKAELLEISFNDIFNLADLQHLQDLFADAHGVASIITDTEGKPITKPSNFTRLCANIIRKTEKGCANCFQSDAVIGRYNPSGAIVQTCLSCGLWDAGASINVGGKYIANWLIGQVRNEQVDEQRLIHYADEIGADKEDFKAAYDEVPVMPTEQFRKIADLLFVFANELSEKAYSNMQLSKQIAEKGRANNLLLEQKEKLSTTLHSIGDGVIATDKYGLIAQMNPVAEKLCGWQLNEALGKPLAEVFRIINAETRMAVADPVAKVFEKVEIVGLANHTVLISKNGTEYQIADSAAPIMNKDGEITGVVLVFSDVTEKYAAQKQIKESEERFRSLLNNLEAGIVVHAPDTSILMNNARASELLGLSSDQMKGKAAIDPAWKFTHEDNTPLTFDQYPVNRIVNSRQSIKNQILGIHQPGKNVVVWVTVNGFPVLDTKGEIIEVVVSFIDITDRLHAVEKIKLSEEKFSKSFFNSPDSIIINRLDDGKIVSVNNGFRKIMGYEEAEVTGKTTIELNFYKNPEERNAIIHALKTTGQALDIECWFITKNGEERLGLLSAAIIDIDGVKHIMSTSRDLTDRKMAEEALKVSESRFRGFFDHSPFGINLFDMKGKVIAVNSVARKYFGVSETDPLSGYSLFDDPSVSDETKQKIKQGQIATEERFIDFNAIRETGMYTSSKNETDKIFISLTYAAYGPYNENTTGIIVFIQEITDRKQAEEELKQAKEQLEESQERLFTYMNSIPDIICYKDGYGKWLLANNADLELFCLQGVDYFGKTDLELSEYTNEIYKNAFINCQETDEVAWKQKVISNGIEIIPTVKGEKRIYDVFKVPIFHANGERKGLAVIGRDISTLYETQNNLIAAKEQAEEREEYFRSIFENSPVGKSITGLDGSLRTNKAFSEMLGYSFEEFQTKNLIEVTHPDDIPKSKKAIEKLLNGEKSVIRFEKKYIHKNGTVIYADVVTTLQKSKNGKPMFFITSVNDITERKLAEVALSKSESEFRLLAEAMPQIVWITRPDGWNIFFNQQWVDYTGLTLEESYGDGWNKPFHPDDKQHAWDAWQYATTNLATYSLECRLRRFDGLYKWWLIRGIPILDENGAIQKWFGTCTDIDELKISEENLKEAKLRAEEADRLKSAFLANMSHEIRTPMNGILGFSELLKEPGLTGEQQQEYIRIIEKSGARMLNTINDIVSISKIESGIMEVSHKESNINQQIEYIYDFFKPELEAKGMEFSFRNSLAAKDAIIRTDREKLYAILTNLVKNAIKYTNKGSIDFGYFKKGDNLEFYVKDTGIGIPKNRQEAVFERFVQADIEDKMAHQGAGLGLAITKSYVEMLGGKIWLDSELGIGSTFYFTLPYNFLSTDKNRNEKVVPVHNEENQFKDLTILITEDDEISERLISITVSDFSKEIIIARTGHEAIEICRSNPAIDLILMDIRLPDLNGYAATRQIRQFNKDVIIIAQTAFALSGDKEKAIEAGCNDYMAKPINKTVFHALLRKYFGNSSIINT